MKLSASIILLINSWGHFFRLEYRTVAETSCFLLILISEMDGVHVGKVLIVPESFDIIMFYTWQSWPS